MAENFSNDLMQECKTRRQQLMQQMGPHTIAVLFAAPSCTRNSDTHYPYRQDSDFYYLTGFTEPESVLFLIPGRPEGEYVLFCRERDRAAEIWNGLRAGLIGACEQFHADQAFAITELATHAPALLTGKNRLFSKLGSQPAPVSSHAVHNHDQQILDWLHRLKQQVRAGISVPSTLETLDTLLHELRLIKSTYEIKQMRHGISVSAHAHRRAMQQCRAGWMEYQLAAEYLHAFIHNGCAAEAYSSIVAGGANACILHYTDNNQPLRADELVLVDAGGEYASYAADITRTFPVNGVFTEPQKKLYELVLAAQLAAIETIKPGASWNAPHDTAVRVLTAGLVDLGLLTGELETLIEQGAYRDFYMHRTGHWLGLDVHDAGAYKQNGAWRALMPGMVLTVEPGLYVATDCLSVDPQWRGIGIRIEDDVLVTETGCEVLSHEAPKTVCEIETLMSQANSS